jgi:hypothetical protein
LKFSFCNPCRFSRLCEIFRDCAAESFALARKADYFGLAHSMQSFEGEIFMFARFEEKMFPELPANILRIETKNECEVSSSKFQPKYILHQTFLI